LDLWQTSLRGIVLAARQPPAKRHKAQTLPTQIGRQDQKPGNRVSVSNLAVQRAKEVSEADATVGTEYSLANLINNYWYDDQAQKQQTYE
jgi:hypothetical protein